jgi:hypothetical protein
MEEWNSLGQESRRVAKDEKTNQASGNSFN